MINIYIDGACAANGSEDAKMGIGVVIEWQEGQPLILSKFGGHGTNNIAEYSALNEALILIHKHEIKSAKILSDSNLVVSQVTGKWKCKDSKLIPLCDLACRRIADLSNKGYEIKVEYIPRIMNIADTPAKNGYRNA